jgi:hypothetical protein
MNNEFCPDCGHLLSKRATHCVFCGWSDRIDYLAYRGFDQDMESDLVYTLADEFYSEPGIGA